MAIHIKNWKLTILALSLIIILTSLGAWQVSRGLQKRQLLHDFHARTQHTPLQAQDFSHLHDLRFYQARLTGEYDNAHTFLLDNKTFKGRAGYQIYTPFKVKNPAQQIAFTILVDRGFVPVGYDRQVVPNIRAIDGEVTITGLLNVPPKQIALGKQLFDPFKNSHLMRVEALDFAQLEKSIGYSFFPYTLTLAALDRNAYAIEWQAVNMPPERHYAYAAQWFALALTLLILFAVLNRSQR